MRSGYVTGLGWSGGDLTIIFANATRDAFSNVRELSCRNNLQIVTVLFPYCGSDSLEFIHTSRVVRIGAVELKLRPIPSDAPTGSPNELIVSENGNTCWLDSKAIFMIDADTVNRDIRHLLLAGSLSLTQGSGCAATLGYVRQDLWCWIEMRLRRAGLWVRLTWRTLSCDQFRAMLIDDAE